MVPTVPNVLPRISGSWPGRLELRTALAKAVAYPWNERPEHAVLRLERGGAGFLEACTLVLGGLGCRAVVSPPLPAAQLRTWDRAGFRVEEELVVLEKPLETLPPPGCHRVRQASDADLAAVLEIDRQSFPSGWRIGAVGLREALAATPRSVLLVSGDTAICGYALVGAARGDAYLQRLAVASRSRRLGHGSSLLAEAESWASSQGATRIRLNTKPSNLPALGLYREAGYRTTPSPLYVLTKALGASNGGAAP